MSSGRGKALRCGEDHAAQILWARPAISPWGPTNLSDALTPRNMESLTGACQSIRCVKASKQGAPYLPGKNGRGQLDDDDGKIITCFYMLSPSHFNLQNIPVRIIPEPKGVGPLLVFVHENKFARSFCSPFFSWVDVDHFTGFWKSVD